MALRRILTVNIRNRNMLVPRLPSCTGARGTGLANSGRVLTFYAAAIGIRPGIAPERRANRRERAAVSARFDLCRVADNPACLTQVPAIYKDLLRGLWWR